jgi:hypothetical protein
VIAEYERVGQGGTPGTAKKMETRPPL